MTALLKALSIRQPWAHLIVEGHKTVENRTWETPYRGPVLIHAGKKHDDQFDVDWLADQGLVVPHDFSKTQQMGGFVGIADIVDCVDRMDSPWFFGPFGFVLENARPLPFMPYKGALGIFQTTITLDDFNVPS